MPLLNRREQARCLRCNALLEKCDPQALERSLALVITALWLFLLANAFPLLALKAQGQYQDSTLLSASLSLYQNGQFLLALLVFLTTFVFPLLNLLGILYLLLSVRLKRSSALQQPLFHFLHKLQPWNMLEVFMLAILVSVVKLSDMADILPNVALYAFGMLIFVIAALNASLNFDLLWRQLSDQPLTMRQRIPHSLQKTWAYLIAAAILYIPANTLPVMTVMLLGKGQADTLIGGVLHLIEGGMWPLALIVFIASVFVPLLKLFVLTGLLISIHWRSPWRPLDRTRLYRITEWLGRWSMVDIFVIAILVALVQFGTLASIEANMGSLSFAAVVVLTMFAAHSFDPRLIWDTDAEPAH